MRTLSPTDARPTTTLVVARLSPHRRWMVWGIALLFTAVAVHWSARNGRLAQDPTFDDVGYFIDGAERQAVLDGRGLMGLASNCLQNPPHSAFSSILALASFETLGVNDWAPYVFNGFVLAAFLFFCCRIFGDLRTVEFYSLLLFCLTIPFALRAIHDFRPDFAVALATGAFVWFGLATISGRRADETRHAVVAGLLLGAALWIKPTLFAHTLAIATVVGVCIAASQWFPGFGDRSIRRSLLTTLRFGGIGIAVAAPYYLLNGRQTLEYFVFNTRGADAHLANFKGPVWEVVQGFLWDGAQTFTMGRYLWLSLFISLMGLVWAACRRDARIAFQTVGLLLLAATSLSIFIYGRHNNEYFGMPYQMLVLFAALTPLAAIIRVHAQAFILGPALLLLSCTPIFFSPLGLFWVPAPEANPQHGWNRKLVEALVRDSGFRWDVSRRNLSPTPVFVTFAGAVNAYAMKWDCIKERLPFDFSDLHRSGDAEAQLRLARQAAYVVVATSAAESVYPLPSTGLQDALLTSLQADKDFREVQVSAEPFPPYRLFRDVRVAGKGGTHNTVAVGWPFTGFLPIEGPYPQWELPEVRWGTFPGSTITVTIPEATVGTMKITVRGQPGAVIEVQLNGSSLGEHVQKSAGFESAEFSLLLRAGSNLVSMDYQVPGTDPTPGTRALLFSQIELTATP